MSSSSPIITSLITGGLGATLGGVLTAALQVVSKRGESRATAAELVTRAAGQMVDRLDRENKQLREAILLLTDVLDEVLPGLSAPEDAIRKLKAAKMAAQKAV
jgi:hypothetical protein